MMAQRAVKRVRDSVAKPNFQRSNIVTDAESKRIEEEQRKKEEEEKQRKVVYHIQAYLFVLNLFALRD